MQEVKRIGVMSVAKISALFGVFVGLIAGILFALASKVADAAAVAGLEGMTFGASSIITLPLMYGVIYFLGGLIGAAIYNLFAKWIGGVKIDIGASTGKKKK